MSDRISELQKAICDNDVLLVTRRLTPHNVNFIDVERRMTLLMWAVSLRRHSIVELLLRCGASLYPRDMFHFNVIHHAAWHADTQIMEMLLFITSSCVDRGEETKNARTSSPKAPHFRPGARSLVDLAHSSTKRTPLMLSSMRGEGDQVFFLVEKAGADPWLKDSNGYTAIDLAAQNGHKSVVKYLLTKATDAADAALEKTRSLAEDNCENVITISQQKTQKELNILLCSDWLPQSLVASS